MKPIEEYSFREFDGKFIFTDIPLGFEEIEGFESKNANALLCYGYIDEEHGITFELLSFAEKTDDGFRLLGGNDAVRYFFRISFLYGCNAESAEGIDEEIFKAKIFIINTGYAVSDDIKRMREIRPLDEFRHPEYPDMVKVDLSKKDVKPEKVWVVCSGIKENGMFGKISGGAESFGLSDGEEINFGVVKLADELACISIIK